MLFMIAWAGILAMPYSILSKAIDGRASGIYGHIQFYGGDSADLHGILGGAMVSLIRNAAFGKGAYMALDGAAKAAADSRIAACIFIIAGVFMLLASLFVGIVKEKNATK